MSEYHRKLLLRRTVSVKIAQIFQRSKGRITTKTDSIPASNINRYLTQRISHGPQKTHLKGLTNYDFQIGHNRLRLASPGLQSHARQRVPTIMPSSPRPNRSTTRSTAPWPPENRPAAAGTRPARSTHHPSQCRPRRRRAPFPRRAKISLSHNGVLFLDEIRSSTVQP